MRNFFLSLCFQVICCSCANNQLQLGGLGTLVPPLMLEPLIYILNIRGVTINTPLSLNKSVPHYEINVPLFGDISPQQTREREMKLPIIFPGWLD